MTLDDLEVFIAVCQAENLSAVARELNCTQPAVSQHISRLEKEFGVALLERRARGVAMTQAGRVFYDHALEGLDAIKQAVKQVRQLQEGEAGSLGISTGGTTVRHLMKEAILQFRSHYPKVELHFHSANSHRRCIDALRNEQADLAFVTMGEPLRGLEQHPVIEAPWVLVMPDDSPLTINDAVTLTEIRHLPYIRLKDSSTSQSQLEQSLADSGIQLETSALVDDWDTAILFAGLGLGYAITPLIHAQRLAEEDNVRYVLIKDITPVEFGWASRRWKSLPKAATAFIEIFAEKMKESPVHSLSRSPSQPPLQSSNG